MLDFQAEPSATLRLALESAVGPHDHFFIKWLSPDAPAKDIEVDGAATVEDARLLFGEELYAAVPGLLHFHHAGYGEKIGIGAGAFDDLITVIEFARAGGKVAGRFVDRLRYERHRELARIWDEHNVVRPDLKDLIIMTNPWQKDDFDRIFGLPRDRGAALLRALNYQHRPHEPLMWDHVEA